MKKLILCAALLIGTMSVSAQTQSKDGGISEDMMARIRQGYTASAEQKAIKNALASNSISALAINADNLAMCDTHFSHQVKNVSKALRQKYKHL